VPNVQAVLLKWIPPFFWMAAIFAVSGTPGADLPQFGSFDYILKKTGHAVAYAFLALLFRRALGWQIRQVGWAWLASVLYALADEFHQSFVPGRHPSFVDVFMFDGMGAAVALWASWRFFRPSAHARSAKSS
jgi:VanZ family protein